MNFKAIGGKFLKGAISGAITAFGTLQVTGNLDKDAWKGIGLALISAAFHSGWETIKQVKDSTP